MTRLKILVAGLFATALFAATSKAQELPPNEVSVQGIGFFTKDSNNNQITQHTTDSGGLLVSYRNRFSRLFGADLSYGYTRNTQQNLTSAGALTFSPTSNLGGIVPGSDTQAKATFVYGGGADYDINDHFALRLEYRGL